MSDIRDARPRWRNLVGTLGLIAFLVAYSLVVMALFASRMADQPVAVQTLFYVVAGMAWLLPARWLLRWMARG